MLKIPRSAPKRAHITGFACHACEPTACLKFPGVRPSGHTSLGLFAMLASLQHDCAYPNKNSRLSSGRQISDGTASKMSIMKKFVWFFSKMDLVDGDELLVEFVAKV